MKKILFTVAIATIMSCNSSEQKERNSSANADDRQNTSTASANIPGGMENILGDWTLIKLLRDDNGNHKIDENEQSAVIDSKNSIKLNADGTCKYETIMDGRYKITEDNGRKRLIYYDMSGNEYPMKLYINSVSKDELVININNAGGSQFEIYRRP
jgi:hypothetical protein